MTQDRVDRLLSSPQRVDTGRSATMRAPVREVVENVDIMEIRTFTLVRHTLDYESMCEFYGCILEMAVVDSWDRPGTRGAVFAPAGAVNGATVEVLELDGVGVPGVAPVNLVLSLFVADAQAAHAQLQRAGADIVRGLEDTPWGHRSFGVDDPDGLRIWIVEVLPHE